MAFPSAELSAARILNLLQGGSGVVTGSRSIEASLAQIALELPAALAGGGGAGVVYTGPRVWIPATEMEIGAFATGSRAWSVTPSTNAQTLWQGKHTSAVSIDASEVDRVGSLFLDFQQEDTNLVLPDTGIANNCSFAVSDGLGSTSGEFLLASGVIDGAPDTFELWTVPVASLFTNFTKVTVGGANIPPDLDAGVYYPVFVSSDRLIIWHDDKVYFGDITDSTTIDFDDAPVVTALTQSLSLPTDINAAMIGCDGAEILIGKTASNTLNDPVWNFETITVAGVSTKKMNGVVLPLGNSSSSSGDPIGLIKIEGVWCVAMAVDLDWLAIVDLGIDLLTDDT